MKKTLNQIMIRLLSLLALASGLHTLMSRAADKAPTKKADVVENAKSGLIKEKARLLSFHTESVDGKTHWMPETVDVKPGEKLHLVFENNLATGPDFHGVQIPEFKIEDKVMRGKKVEHDVTVPNDFKAGEITIKCQFHPGHQPAHLKVSPSEPSKK